MIEGWREFRIEDLAEIRNEIRVPLSKLERSKRSGAFPYYGASGIIDHVDDFLFEGEHVLISEDGENLKSRKTPIAFKADGRFWVNNHAHILRGKKPFHNNLICQYFSQLDLSAYITGAVQPKLSKASLTNIPILLPEDEEQQKAIAEVLSSLDGKIDLLQRQNAALEALAETLFRQTFIEEAQDDWDYVELGNYINCQNGVSYKSADLSPSNTAMLTLKNFHRDGSFRFDGFKEFVGQHKDTHIVEQGDLVVAHTDITQDAAIVGNPIRVMEVPAYETLVISMDLVKVTPKCEWIPAAFLYQLMRTPYFKHHCIGYANGSTVLHLSKSALPEFEFFMPPKEIIDEIGPFLDSAFHKQTENHRQIQTLEKLRDTLLPKLMSGEVRVAYDREAA